VFTAFYGPYERCQAFGLRIGWTAKAIVRIQLRVMTTTGYQSSSTLYDVEFNAIAGLTWLPWVGENFSRRSQKQRLLVIGESHYYRGTTPEELETNRKSYLADRQTTRDIVSEQLVNHEWEGGNRTLDAIPKLLFNTHQIDHGRLWADSAYYNFVQRPMNWSVNENPCPNDFTDGWKVFVDVIGLLKPSHCLFIGVSAANHFNLGLVTRHEKVGGVWPRSVNFDAMEVTAKLIFVHHLGRCKCVGEWHDYLRTQHSDFMNWLGTESYQQAAKI
jgi:hypothetical protein